MPCWPGRVRTAGTSACRVHHDRLRRGVALLVRGDHHSGGRNADLIHATRVVRTPVDTPTSTHTRMHTHARTRTHTGITIHQGSYGSDMTSTWIPPTSIDPRGGLAAYAGAIKQFGDQATAMGMATVDTSKIRVRACARDHTFVRNCGNMCAPAGALCMHSCGSGRAWLCRGNLRSAVVRGPHTICTDGRRCLRCRWNALPGPGSLHRAPPPSAAGTAARLLFTTGSRSSPTSRGTQRTQMRGTPTSW